MEPIENRQANVSGVNRSVVSIGTAGAITNSIVEASGGAQIGSLPDFLAYLRGLLPGMSLEPSSRAEIEAEIQTAQAQLGSPRPKQGIITQSLRTIRSLLEGVAGNAAYAQLPAMIDKLIS